MMVHKDILQICSYYINDKLYTSFFKSLERLQITSIAYVFANVNAVSKRIIENKVVVSYCYNTVDRCFFHIKHKKALVEAEKRFEFSNFYLMHAHSLFSNGYIAYKLNQKYDIPYIVTVRYPDVLTFFRFMVHLRGLGIKILKNAKGIIFLSESYKEKTMRYIPAVLKKEIISKTAVIPNGIDDFWIDNSPTMPKEVHEELKLLFVGRVNKNKNPEALIEICKLLISKGKQCTLTIVGNIEDRSYSKLFKKYSFIHYYSYCDNNQLLRYYRASDIFVMLSHKESFGIVYAEAMSQGLPVIYTKDQGFYSQFDEGIVGYGVNAGDYRQAVECIERIIQDYSNFSMRCLKYSKQFSWDTVAKKVAQMYEDAAQEV